MERDIPDHATAVFEKIEWPKCVLYDFSKVDCRDGVIHFSLYRQDGTLQSMRVPDTYDNRLYVSWIQIHDRYTVPAPAEAKETE